MGAIAMNTVQLKVDSTRLFNNLQHAFSAGAMMGELLQNARRAGASRIDIHYDEYTGTLIVEDNGAGISDLQTLLTAAESGWNASIVDHEHPFGLGFLSVLYAGRHVTVETVGQRFSADTQELLDGHRVPVEPCEGIAGTRITIRGYGWKVDTLERQASRDDVRFNDMNRVTEGFPVEVIFNGRPMPRPYARTGGQDWIETDVGSILVLGDVARTHQAGLFVQGLPLERGRIGNEVAIIHLNGTFQVKLPDRQHLQDPTASAARIEKALASVIRQKLEAWKAAVGPEAFVLDWSERCAYWKCRDLLDDIACVPASWFVDWQSSRPGYDAYGDIHRRLESTKDEGPVVSRTVLEKSPGVYEMPSVWDADTTHPHAAQCWLAAGRTWTLMGVGTLPIGKDHWLHDLIREETDQEFEVMVDGVMGDQRVDLTGFEVMNLAVAEHVRITHLPSGETREVDAAIKENTLYVTREGLPVWVTRLIADYIDDDRYDEAAEDQDQDRLEDAFHRIVATDPADLVAHVLRHANGMRHQGKLVNVSVTVDFDASGTFRSTRVVERPRVEAKA